MTAGELTEADGAGFTNPSVRDTSDGGGRGLVTGRDLPAMLFIRLMSTFMCFGTLVVWRSPPVFEGVWMTIIFKLLLSGARSGDS